MEPNRFEVITTTDKSQRDRMFEEFRNSTEANERQAVKFSGSQETRDENGQVTDIKSTFSVAYPKEVDEQNHGSARNPRKFPGRKVKA